MWAWEHAKALSDEYTRRCGKVHASSRFLDILAKAPDNVPNGELEAFAMAMPDNFRLQGLTDPTKAYKSYLNSKYKEWLARDKQIRVEWKNASKPDWVEI